MSSQRYERVPAHYQSLDPMSPSNDRQPISVPASPPPSFRSRAPSPVSRHHPSSPGTDFSDADRTLADTFDVDGASDSDDENGGDDRRRLLRNTSPLPEGVSGRPSHVQRTVTTLPVLVNSTIPAPNAAGRTHNGDPPLSAFSSSNDGVFANLNAKPERGEKSEEQPPTYEQAAADATPPYWETTILAPGMVSDEVYVDGLPVGSLFSFVWNGMISMSFQLVGFLLTYLLHTTHAAKNGSRAGLGITLVQYGFYMKSATSLRQGNPDPQFGQPPDPNSHDFDPSAIPDSAAAAVAAVANSQGQIDDGNSGGTLSGMASSEWLAYILMIVGWFILIRAVSDFFKARRHEQLVLQSPERGLNVPIVAEGENSETVV